MGCDIHITVEKRVNGKWLMVRVIEDGPALCRSYYRFARLAGVRNKYNIAHPTPRGLPDDVSESTLYHHSLDNYHDESWMSVREAMEIFRDTADSDYGFQMENGQYTNEEYKKWPGLYFGIEGDDIDDMRIVFWFDN